LEESKRATRQNRCHDSDHRDGDHQLDHSESVARS
jgi:hypothetical protein